MSITATKSRGTTTEIITTEIIPTNAFIQPLLRKDERFLGRRDYHPRVRRPNGKKGFIRLFLRMKNLGDDILSSCKELGLLPKPFPSGSTECSHQHGGAQRSVLPPRIALGDRPWDFRILHCYAIWHILKNYWTIFVSTVGVNLHNLMDRGQLLIKIDHFIDAWVSQQADR